MRSALIHMTLCGSLLALAGCGGGQPVVYSARDQAALNAMQTRSYATADQGAALRDIVGTLEKSGFALGALDTQQGEIAAVKPPGLQMQVSVRPSPAGTEVHATALMSMHDGSIYEVDDPQVYARALFDPLGARLVVAASAPPPAAGQSYPAASAAYPATESPYPAAASPYTEAPAPYPAAAPAPGAQTGAWRESPSP